MDEKKKIEISSSSLVGLKAELLKKQEQFKQEKLAKESGQSYVRHQKKPTVFKRHNPGINQRIQKDEESKLEERKDLDTSRAMLEAKAKIYDKMVSGQMETNEQTNSVFLVDFDRKQFEGSHHNELRSSNEDDELADESEIPPAATPDEEWVDYVDTLGRSRRCMRKDLPLVKDMDKNLNPDKFQENEEKTKPPTEDEVMPQMLSNDMYREMQRKKWEKEQEELMQKDSVHYQNVRFDEVRELGVGYFDFSKDEEERRKQMESLSNLREETLNKREQRERLKAKRKAALQERLAKVKQRRQIKTDGDDAMASLEGSICKDDEVIKEPVVDVKKVVESKLDQTMKLISKEKLPTKVREWDVGKVLEPTAWDKQKEKERNERLAEFAPPSIYYQDKNQRGTRSHQNIDKPSGPQNFENKQSSTNIPSCSSSSPSSSLNSSSSDSHGTNSNPLLQSSSKISFKIKSGTTSHEKYQTNISEDVKASDCIKETLAFYRNQSKR